ncbi:putative bifunctional diguanylate cyclase/phosphodiesterase [Nocardioides seonyuensis]|nr:EAL domain-containing protein [Nocardioides seonyuensis]
MSFVERALAAGDGFNRTRPSLRLMRPFGVVLGIGLLVVLVPPHPTSTLMLLVTTLVYELVLLAYIFSARSEERTWLAPTAVLLTFVYIALLRDASGGAESPVLPLLIGPVLWLAITGRRQEMYASVALVGVVIMAPVLLIGGEKYPWDSWRLAAVYVPIAHVLGRVVQRIVMRLERESRTARSATERSARLFIDAPYGVAVLDQDGRIVLANRALGAMVGLRGRDMVGRFLTEFSAASDECVEQNVSRVLETDQTAVATDCVLRNSSGQDVHVSLSSRMLRHADVTEPDILLVNIVDVSESRRYQDRLAHLVDHDVLTGLGNRRLFDDELQRHLERCRRYGPSGSVVLLDLDNFKQVNDTLGHNAGDQLLVVIAGVLRRAVRSTDVVARLGGDEFGIIVTDGDEGAAERVAQDIVDQVSEHAATLDGVSRRVTASVGAVTFKAASEQAVDILALADMTMYDAKEAGRNQIAMLREGEMRPPRLSARLQWQDRIEEALENDRFELHLQPILDVTNGHIDSAEALLRLRGDDGELVPPGRFVYIAERSGLMPRVDAWVIERSIAMLADLRTIRPDFCLEVNISGHSIGDAQVEQTIRDSLVRHDVDPRALILEITETAAVADVALAREFAQRLARVGCRFALDDFGAGFGSFYYLKHLLFDYVKIDGEFVANSHVSRVDRTILRSIVGIARDLGKETVAEFVSSPEVLEVVRAEGVDYAQGYLIGKPIPVDEFVAEFLQPEASSSFVR